MQNPELKHLDQASISQTELTIDALARIVPSCITEVRDAKTGSIKHAVDFHVLRQLLGDKTVEDVPEAYEFTWVGKQEARREAAKSICKTLRPVPEDSVDWDNTQNIYIEGDNLEALKLLQKSYLGKVKMIYIDPPYNTGNDFVYHDDFKVGQNEYDEKAGNVDEEGNRLVSRTTSSASSSLDDAFKKNTDSNGRFHSDWCSMIYSRLMIARSLLTEDGVIFISIDDHEVENLRKICEEVFGESNFVATINWRRSGGRQDSKYYAVVHEYILCFAKDISEFEAGEEIKTGEVYPKFDEEKQRYYKTQLLRKWGSNSLRENRPNLYYPIKGPDGSDVYPTIYQEAANSDLGFVKIQGRWRWGASNLANAVREGRIEFQRNKWGEWVPYEKIFAPLEGEEKTKKYSTWLDDVSNGTETLKKLFSNAIFDYSKSTEMIIRFLKMANLGKEDICLDFFSGSATTAHAVMQLNAEDGGNRRFIMVQLPEETSEDSEAYKAAYKNICEIGKERIRRAGKKIKEELASKNKTGQQEGGLFDEKSNQEEATSSLDTGFRVFRIDSGNMKEDLEQAPSDVDQMKLDFYLDNVKEDRTELDLLFGCMLNWGVQLSLPMSMETVDGCNIYTVNEGDLVACLTKDKPVTENIVRAIAEKSPLRVLFRDGSFASDASKINIFEQFKQLMDWSDEEIVKNVRVL